jgi:Zn-finger nucleic acid-binding protein
MNSPVTALTCPKCHGTMRTYERGGVHVDQCADCRGIFLDRGELERLMDAENGFYEQQPRQEYRPDYRPDGRHDDRYDNRYDPRRQHKKKRGGFLGDMFDFG